MQFTTFAVASVMAAAVAAHSNVTYVTEVLTEYTTYCPEPTTLTYNDVTYTITEATTLTITDCPCTVSKPVEVKPSAPVYVNSTVPEVTAPAPVVPSQTPVTVAPSGAPSGTGAPQPSKPAFTGAANRAAVGSAAGLAGLLGFAAYIL
jgi:hypothetical protein